MDKINIAELLKDCPKGMELDCTMFEDVKFICIEDEDKPICIRTGDIYRYLTKFGTWTFDENAKCVIFPKGKTSWEGFQRPFKDGDIVTWKDRGSLIAFIYKERKNVAVVKHHFALYTEGLGILTDGEIALVESELVFATEEEKAELFDAIKANGYKWNQETKTLDKLIESKEDTDDGIVNDEIVMSGIYFDRENYADEVELHLNKYEIEIRDGKTYAVFKNQETKTLKPKFKVDDKIKLKGGDEFGIITQVSDCCYTIKCKNNTHCWPIKKQDDWELINEPKFKVGDRIRRKNSNEEYTIISISDYTYYYRLNEHCTGSLGIQLQDDYELIPDKFDITTLVPFESRVLVRDYFYEEWKAAFWGCLTNNYYGFNYATIGGRNKQCIPYEGNEHLLGTTNDCDEYFKTWE